MPILYILSLFFLPHSDSGDSLFVTQSVTSALRNVKRHRPSNTQACPFSQESEDKQETVQHEQNGTRGDSDSEASYADLLHRWRKLARINSTRRHRHPRSRRVPPKRMVLPFLKKSDSRKLSVHGNQTIVVRMCKWQKPVNMKVVLYYHESSIETIVLRTLHAIFHIIWQLCRHKILRWKKTVIHRFIVLFFFFLVCVQESNKRQCLSLAISKHWKTSTLVKYANVSSALCKKMKWYYVILFKVTCK